MDLLQPRTLKFSQFPFFSLAREVRDQIYHYLFSDTELDIIKDQHMIKICYDHPAQPQDYFPAWLLLSKTILIEGLAQFARHAACTAITPPSQAHNHDHPHHIHRDMLLLSSVQEIRLNIAAECTYHHDTTGYDTKHETWLIVTPVNKYGQVWRSDIVPFEVRTREFVPALERLTLRIEVKLVGWEASPDSVLVSALGLRALGVRYKHVRIEIMPPAIQIIKGQVTPVAVVAAAYPRFQQALQYLAWLSTRGCDSDLDDITKAKVDEEYWERDLWMPKENSAVSEADSSTRRFEELQMSDRRRAVKEWVDEKTGAWNVEISPATKPVTEPYVSQARGLRAFTSPQIGLLPGGDVEFTNTEDIFRMDVMAKHGSVSYSCASTGEMLWTQDGGVTGYMRNGEDACLRKPSELGGFLAALET